MQKYIRFSHEGKGILHFSHFGQNIPSASILNNLPFQYIFQNVKKLRYFAKLSDTRRIHDLDHSSKRNILVDDTQLTIVHK